MSDEHIKEEEMEERISPDELLMVMQCKSL